MDRPIIRVWITDTDMGKGEGGGEAMDRQKKEEKRRRQIQEGGYSGASLAPGMERSRNRGV